MSENRTGINSIFSTKKKLDFSGRTLLMGILNVTPDSFSDGGDYFDTDAAVKRGVQMASEGADVIDVGGESTRPGSEPVSAEEEMTRVIPVIERLSSDVEALISIDTYKADVAEAALNAGASIINDIGGLRFDERMADVAGERGAPVIIMHIKGTPRDMQLNPQYDDLLGEIADYFADSVIIAEDAGIPKENLIIDPGLGFGKQPEQNFELMVSLEYFRPLGCPILAGPSRKSFLWKTLGVEPKETVHATAAAVTACILAGVDIVRVHDVKEILQVVRIADKLAGKT